MIVSKGVSFLKIIQWSWVHIVWLLLFSSGIATLYYFKILNIVIPWLPISVIGTAVAFFVGFKNNQAYDRMWEARKIWGGLVNDSRTWGMQIDGYITNTFNKDISSDELKEIKKRLIHRHIAWLYIHRSQLLVPTSWEHINQSGRVAKKTSIYQKKFGVGLVEDDLNNIDLSELVSAEELDRLGKTKNIATQMINEQSQELTKLRDRGIIDDFRHIELMQLLSNFYHLQGKNERIKKFPLPRQYANTSRYFVGIFLLLFPFSMIPELMAIGDVGFWISIPITALVGWVYVMMELVGDYTENPFQGMANDIPMLSLCRTIEIDLREILKESDLPAPIKAKKNILM
ncbi:MAG: putative membrane protein [Ulvibacter sp.]|jgi:putative membrane protein